MLNHNRCIVDGMTRFGKMLSLFACVAMLMLQGLGAHLHVDIVGHEGEPHHDVHFDGSLSGDHASSQHDAHFDVSFLETAPASPGLDLALLPLTHSLELPGVVTQSHWASLPATGPPRHLDCYLPPPRAPPSTV